MMERASFQLRPTLTRWYRTFGAANAPLPALLAQNQSSTAAELFTLPLQGLGSRHCLLGTPASGTSSSDFPLSSKQQRYSNSLVSWRQLSIPAHLPSASHGRNALSAQGSSVEKSLGSEDPCRPSQRFHSPASLSPSSETKQAAPFNASLLAPPTTPLPPPATPASFATSPSFPALQWPGPWAATWQPHSTPSGASLFSTRSPPAQWAAERQERKERGDLTARRAAYRRAISQSHTAVDDASATSASQAPDSHVWSSVAQGSPSSQGESSQPPSPIGGSSNPYASGTDLLGRADLMVTRKVEWANMLLGFEQENKYEVMDPRNGQAVGYILETSNWLMRQLLRRRRHFRAKILDCQNNLLFEVDRPFFFISSHMRVHRGTEEIGEVRGRWHLWRRNYDLYARRRQFAEVKNPGLWWWTFILKDEEGGQLAVVDRNFRGLGYEAFTDAGQYLIRLGPPLAETTATSHLQHALPTGLSPQQAQVAAQQAAQIPYLEVVRELSLEERAVGLAFAVSLDCDYFSRHSEGGGGWLPFLPFIFAGEG